MAQPWHTTTFVPMVANFVPLLAPANQQTSDTVQFYNTALAIFGGCSAAAVSFRLLPPLSAEFRSRRLLSLTLRDLRGLATQSRSALDRGLGGPDPQPAQEWDLTGMEWPLVFILIVWPYGMPDLGALNGKLATANRGLRRLSELSGRSSSGAPIGRRSVLNDTARRSNRPHPRHLVDRHMGRDGTSTLAVAPRGHYCGGGDIGHCRVVNESPAIKPGIPMTSSANDLAASLSSPALTAGSPRWRSARRWRKECRRPVSTPRNASRRGRISSGPRWRTGDCEPSIDRGLVQPDVDLRSGTSNLPMESAGRKVVGFAPN
jgi:hypothetical protein